jgi:hypothetical protein
MRKILISISVSIIYFSAINCIANEKQLTKFENELLNYAICSLQSLTIENISNNNDLKMFMDLNLLSSTISSLAYAMVLDSDGKILVHNNSEKLLKKLDDEATKKVLENRNFSEVLIQKLKLKLNNDRDVLDLSLPLFSSPDAKEYFGAVRFAISLN